MSRQKSGVNNDIIVRKELYPKIVKLFNDAKVLVSHPKDKETMEKFKGATKYSEHRTIGDRLPYQQTKGMRSRIHSKASCVFAIMCEIIRAYDKICREDLCDTKRILGLMKWLETIIHDGLESYKITGDLAKGFILKVER